MKTYRSQITDLAEQAGRDPRSIKVLFAASPLIDSSEAAAQERWDAARAAAAADIDRALASMSYVSGVDFARYDLDQPLPPIKTNAAQASTKLLVESASSTLRELAQGRRSDVELVGTPDTVAAKMGEIMEYVEGDGYLISGPIERRYVAEITDGLAPALRRRGLIRDGYAHATFRDNLLAF
jgi:alkanesulfonate monooxygenase SsuD/methylene tetrahydromethanopterin reductase-like flavin-dependent oxidoreductase (luciferase family)